MKKVEIHVLLEVDDDVQLQDVKEWCTAYLNNAPGAGMMLDVQVNEEGVRTPSLFDGWE